MESAQGTVGIWPAFSWASRAALSPASCAAFSFEWNVPGVGAEALGLLPDDAGAVVVGVVAALAELPANSAAPIAPPVRVEPTIATATAAFRMGVMCRLLLLTVGPELFGPIDRVRWQHQGRLGAGWEPPRTFEDAATIF
jgi:hypothetical protein